MYFVWQSLDRFLSLRQLAVVSFYARPMPSRVFRAPYLHASSARPMPLRASRAPRASRASRTSHALRAPLCLHASPARPMPLRASRAPHACYAGYRFLSYLA